MAFIISIIGTLVAFAGLHLQDKTIHEKRNREIKTKRSFLNRFSRYASLARLLVRPKTVEKIVEKEVEVEKIVETPIVEEKIVYQKVEVPKEVIKKELVHVPLWTQDPGMINKKISLEDIKENSKKKK